ncbi:MAG: glycosyltransferase family 4 protein [Rhodoferax sp.]|nr:glycosyltransferase family 4 protein [Rhodoferax sp.]
MMDHAEPNKDIKGLRPVVLHIAADYRCAHNPNGTTAIPELLEYTAPFAEHVVVSLRRTANPWNVSIKRGSDVAWEYSYFGLPLGIFVGSALKLAARTLRKRAGDDLRRADIIHAHKLSCEAIVAQRCLSANQKLVISVRGSSDVKIAKFHPIARVLMRQALLRAQSVLWVSAWAKGALEKLRLRPAAHAIDALFPNTIGIAPQPNAFTTNRAPAGPLHFCSIFRLDHYKLKGLPELLTALMHLRANGHDLRLDLIGGGTPPCARQIQQLINQRGLQLAVRMLGAMPREQVRIRLAQYDAMVLPSRNETFGLAYLEALSSGLPILFTLNTGIDGYLDDSCGAVGAHSGSVTSIEHALLKLVTENRSLKEKAHTYWNNAGRSYFSREQACERYLTHVLQAAYPNCANSH